ncbi:MAG: class I SAM-dependent methyltransferase [Burkholderiales bacterium]
MTIKPLRALAGLAGAALVATLVSAQSNQPGEFQPQVGQSGKDVIWVPTPDALVDRMLRMANVTPKDFVMDLGSGDGRIAIAASKTFNARAMGIEYNPDMVTLSNQSAAREGVAEMVKFIKADIFETDFSRASVITMYLLPSLNVKLRPKLLDMKAGTRIVSHAFDMGEWVADETATVEGRSAYLWIVPAKTAGTWSLEVGGNKSNLQISQNFQKIEGNVQRGDRLSPLSGSVRGDEIRFSAPDGQGGRREYIGRITGERMEGQSGSERWSATRMAKSG